MQIIPAPTPVAADEDRATVTSIEAKKAEA